jgi:cytochrome c553
MRKLGVFECAFLAAAFLASSLYAPVYAQGPAGTAPSASRSAAGGGQSALAAKGKERFQAYKCYDCHGENGEGTDDAPNLTRSKLTAEQVSKFLQKPSVDAENKGMPDVPTDSPDHQPLVAFVMSLRAKGNQATGKQSAGAPASSASKPAASTAKPVASAPKSGAPAASAQKALVAQGKARFQAYKCYDCHGQNGEGTDDAPNLTRSKLTAEQVSKFLQKPSVDAENKGMPDVPTDSPDHKPLVAYVMSLRAK